jgi:hypothetical protein
MRIKIDKYVITSDPLQYILNESCERGVKSKTPGEGYLSPIGYYTSLYALLTALHAKDIRASKATTIKGLKADIKKATDLVEKVIALINTGADMELVDE